jgi:hypothetical protein
MDILSGFIHEISLIGGNKPVLYLDPGTGSFIIQILISSLVGILYIFRSFFFKGINYIRNIFSPDKANSEEEDIELDD